MAKIVAPTNTGKKVNELIIKNKLSPDKAVLQVLGSLKDKFTLPQGAAIVSEGLNDLVYKDAQGFTHRVQRNGDATSPDFGRVSEIGTDRPAVLPLTDQIPGLDIALQGAISNITSLFDGGGLAPLSEADNAGLQAISDSERNLISQEAARTQGELVTSLYGQGINQSTIANKRGADFTQALGIALGNQASNAAKRKLDLQRFLTELMTGSALNLTGSVTGQETQRATAGAGIDLGREQLDQAGTDAARNFMLEWEKFQAQQNKSKLPGILSGIASLAANFIPGVGPLVSAGISGIGGGFDFGKAGKPPSDIGYG